MVARRLGVALVAGLCALALVLAVGVGSAGAAVTQFGSEGSGAGEFIVPSGVSVDQQSGDVYVVDRNNQRVEKFGPEGAFLLAWGWGVADGETTAPQTCTVTCFQAIQGSGAGQFNFPEGVAVDNASLSLSRGDVYVADTRSRRVEKFDSAGNFLLVFGGEVNQTKDETAGATEAEKNLCTAASGDVCKAGSAGTANGQFEWDASVAVGADGSVYVGDVNRVQKFNDEGAYQAQVALPGSGIVEALAVDAAGDLYAHGGELAGVREYDSAGVEIGVPRDASGTPERVTLGAAGELFVDDEAGRHHLLEYDATGNEIASFDSTATRDGNGLAFSETLGVLYVLGKEAVRFVAPPSPGPSVVSGSESASLVQPRSATLNATVNPEGNDTTYRFEYGTSTSYGTSLPVPEGELPAGFEDTPVNVGLSGLSPRTLYHYRVIATNPAGTFTGPDQTFSTLPPALIEGVSSTNVAATSATLDAELDPLGLDTTYRFEYGTSASYGASVPAGEGDAGGGETAVSVEAHVQGLEPETTYHYRLVTKNALGVVEGEDRSFTTEPAKAGTVLPDGRSWEMVSPVDKQGSALEPITVEGGLIQASVNGKAISYIASAATEEEPQGNRNLEFAQIFSSRGATGWNTRDIDTPNDEVGNIAVGGGPEYRMFSSDLSAGLVESRTNTPLPPLGEGAEQTPYLRDSASGTYTPLVTTQNVLSGAKFGPTENALGVSPISASPDLRHVVIRDHAALTSNAIEVPLTSNVGENIHNESLYEWSNGKLALVSILPDEKPANEENIFSNLGLRDEMVRHAISDDGTRIVWEAEDNATGSRHYFMRDMTRGETVQIDAAQGAKEVTGDNTAVFQTASSDGSRVFFTSTARLTADATTTKGVSQGREEGDLYVFELTNRTGEPLAGKLTDLTVDGNARENASIQGVIGAGEDGSSVYFVADGVLGDGAAHGATAGTCAETAGVLQSEMCNLYVERYQSDAKAWSPPTFIATLSGEDFPSWNPSTLEIKYLTARVSPNGGWLAFMSGRGLTGYDNHDAVSGEPDEEVFLYDAQTGRVSCASCNPTGARPGGASSEIGYPGLLADRPGIWKDRWLGALIPGWTGIDLSHSLYQSRYLSDSGRLFFDSPDALSPADTNGTWDVYEFEPLEVGGCASGSAGFEGVSGGCVGLISSGGSKEESAFLDASETGDDVFFLTTAGLVSQDGDGLFDVYDARACSSALPCLAPLPVSSPACSTSDSCKAAPTPQPAGFGAPASQTFSGVGNVLLPGAKPVVKAKPSTRAGKLASALRACRKKPRHKRVACERQARKRYGPAGKSKTNKSLSLRAGR